MTMEDWSKRLDFFLMADDREVLQDTRKITAEIAKAKAETEFEKYRVVQDRLFMQFCSKMKEKYHCSEKIEFSSCSWEYGWNVKFKKSGKNLCTVYPREGFFTVLVVIGQKEKDSAKRILPECTPELREIYNQTETGNGQKWLMIDLEDRDKLFDDTLRLIEIRRGSVSVRKE